MSVEVVDILSPPTFEPSGAIKPVDEALDAGDWLGVMNLWLVRADGTVLYQQRPEGGWEAGKLDGSVGGFYRAGESELDGLREAQEELGWSPPPKAVHLLGRHLNVSVDSQGRTRNLVVTVCMAPCTLPLSSFVLNEHEVPALYEVAAEDVIAAFNDPGRHVAAVGISCHGDSIHKSISCDDFSYVFGGYHVKIAHIARLYAAGQTIPYY